MLSSIFSDNMMIQCDQPVKVWGIDTPEELISVKLAGNKMETKADKNGTWLVSLPPLPSGLICEMHIKGRKEQVIKNILTGDVWLCSGQSNMEFSVKDAKNAKEDISTANYPEIRFFNVLHKASVKKVDQVVGRWEICTPETIGTATAVGYFFARDIHKSQGRPIGLLHSSWGGTRVEAWMRKKSLLAFDFMQKEIEKYEQCTNDPAEYERELKEWNKDIPKDLENRGFKQGYASASYDISDWKTLDVPGWWTKQGLEFNGVLWYRKNVILPNDWEGKECVLHLGACDKSDQSYFNNEKIGALSVEDDPQAWSAERIYNIPANIVKSGDNTIAVRVFSNVNGGGIIGQPENISVSLKDHPEKSIPLAGKWQYKVEYNLGLIIPPIQPYGEDNPNSPYILFNSMIKPLLNIAIKGVLWYQGESNAKNHQHYKELFKTMISDWRNCWNIGPFPFYFVQLASFIAGTDEENLSPWGEIRQAQEDSLTLQNTEMAVAVDIGNPVDIHPINKQDVGQLLALIALAETYGESIEFSGPVVDKVVLENNQIKISFTHADGLHTPHNNPIWGFKVKNDNRALNVNASIVNDSIILDGDDLSNVVEVSYAYKDCPECNLYNSANLPARPFKKLTQAYDIKLSR